MKLKIILPMMIFAMVLIGCASTGPTTKIEALDRPRISAEYQILLMKAGPDTAKAAQKHEWDWHSYGDRWS